MTPTTTELVQRLAAAGRPMSVIELVPDADTDTARRIYNDLAEAARVGRLRRIPPHIGKPWCTCGCLAGQDPGGAVVTWAAAKSCAYCGKPLPKDWMARTCSTACSKALEKQEKK